MSPRTPLVATVIGALFIGGAVTGTTLALWRDHATVDAGSLGSGAISLTVGGGTTSVALGSISGLTLGTSGNAGTPVALSAEPVIKNDSPTSSKNLRMKVHLDGVTTSPTNATLNSFLQVAAVAVATTGTCPSPASTSMTYKSIATAYATTELTATSLSPQASTKLCVAARLSSAADSTALGQSASLAFTFRGQQVRP